MFILEKCLKSASQKLAGQFRSKVVQIILEQREFKYVQMKGSGPHQKIDNYKYVKIEWGHLKIFSRNTGPEKLRFT
jgi:hypothetical protein